MARTLATPAPTPELAPVTIAIFPESLPINLTFLSSSIALVREESTNLHKVLVSQISFGKGEKKDRKHLFQFKAYGAEL
ncbi:hypothetical protein [Holdemania massiliensis]|uniref:hypothetical protein n=1 Tax=Holdemania massiliensis TaxID=1468449 RepID=UPI00242E161B|nr:hypothetical protein [Holdemania massiliensis]